MFKILGINDEQTACECCGRTGLKKTVVLTDGEREVRYGTECAARAMKVSKREVESGVKAATVAASRTRQEQINREEEGYTEWLLKTYGDQRSTLERRRAWRVA
jgi:ribosome-binding protein aMBF1 (putative translation factor)